ncbi:MAG: hypothetical protein Phyf2KO_09820 [Phycisphaerales bacterium]
MLTPAEIARMEEARQARAMTEIGVESEPILGGIMSYLEPGSWSNQVCGIGLSGKATSEDVARIVEYYTSRGVEPKVEIAQFVDESLLVALAEHKFELRQFETVLARQIGDNEQIDPTPMGGWPVDDEGNELVIERVDPDDEQTVFESWRVAMSGFIDSPREPTEKELNMHRKIVSHPHGDFLVARFGNRIVAAGGAEYPRGDDIAVGVLFGVSVLDEFRRRGIQQAMILHRVIGAQRRGAKVVVIHSVPAASTDRNSMRLGFEPCYTKVIMAVSGEGLEASP